MKNWLGQDIVEGAVVYRGARDGDSSSFRVGQVLSVNEEKRTVKIKWLMSPTARWAVDQKGMPTYGKPYVDVGSPGIDTVVLIDIDLNDFPEWDRADYNN